MPITPDHIIRLLNLQPHPREGGYFVETYRSAEGMGENILPDRYEGERRFATAIYYLLTRETFSAMHRLQSDEIFHFYSGDPVEMLHLHPNGRGEVVLLGSDLEAGMRSQVVVPRLSWQGARLRSGGEWALLGCTVSPGFEFADYEDGKRPILAAAFPQFEGMIRDLTPD